MASESCCGHHSHCSDTVAFTAKLRVCDSYPTHSGVLKFATVLINEGNGYNPDTGIFTCPVAGVYYFTLHASVYGCGECIITKNGEKVVSLFDASNKWSQVSTVSSVIKLAECDQVYVKVWGPGRNDVFATEDNDTVFVGVRLA